MVAKLDVVRRDVFVSTGGKVTTPPDAGMMSVAVIVRRVGSMALGLPKHMLYALRIPASTISVNSGFAKSGSSATYHLRLSLNSTR